MNTKVTAELKKEDAPAIQLTGDPVKDAALVVMSDFHERSMQRPGTTRKVMEFAFLGSMTAAATMFTAAAVRDMWNGGGNQGGGNQGNQGAQAGGR